MENLARGVRVERGVDRAERVPLSRGALRRRAVSALVESCGNAKAPFEAVREARTSRVPRAPPRRRQGKPATTTPFPSDISCPMAPKREALSSASMSSGIAIRIRGRRPHPMRFRRNRIQDRAGPVRHARASESWLNRRPETHRGGEPLVCGRSKMTSDFACTVHQAFCASSCSSWAGAHPANPASRLWRGLLRGQPLEDVLEVVRRSPNRPRASIATHPGGWQHESAIDRTGPPKCTAIDLKSSFFRRDADLLSNAADSSRSAGHDHPERAWSLCSQTKVIDFREMRIDHRGHGDQEWCVRLTFCMVNLL